MDYNPNLFPAYILLGQLYGDAYDEENALKYFKAAEDKELVKRRIYEATKYIPLERLYLSPQCGFASCEIGNKLTEEQQWAKLKLVKEIAEEVWG